MEFSDVFDAGRRRRDDGLLAGKAPTLDDGGRSLSAGRVGVGERGQAIDAVQYREARHAAGRQAAQNRDPAAKSDTQRKEPRLPASCSCMIVARYAALVSELPFT